MAIINKNTNNKYWRICGEKRTLIHRWWEDKPAQPVWKTIGRFLKKLKTELSFDPAILLLGIYLPQKEKKNQNTNSKRYTHLNVQSSITYNCQYMEAT